MSFESSKRKDYFVEPAETSKERRNYALLQAAAVIYSGSLCRKDELREGNEPDYWQTFKSAVEDAKALLAEAEREG